MNRYTNVVKYAVLGAAILVLWVLKGLFLFLFIVAILALGVYYAYRKWDKLVTKLEGYKKVLDDAIDNG